MDMIFFMAPPVLLSATFLPFEDCVVDAMIQVSSYEVMDRTVALNSYRLL